MKGKGKDKKTGFTDFLNYRRNNLTGKEKNSFERELQKDPFASEAGEGFSLLDPSVLAEDMAELEKRLSSRTLRSRSFLWYRIAASFAVLMVITTIFLVVQNNRPEKVASEGEKSNVVFDILKPEAVRENAPSQAIARNQEMAIKEKSPVTAEMEYRASAESRMETAKIAAGDTTGIIADENFKAAEEPVKDDLLKMKVTAPAAAGAVVKSNYQQMVRGRVISSEDNLPVPGAVISVRGTTVATTTDNDGNFELLIPAKAKPDLIASFIGMKTKEFGPEGDSVISVTLDPDLTSLDEVVITGYGVRRSNAVAGAADAKKAEVNEESAYSYTEAEPIGGKEAFNRYVEKNIVRPSGQDTRRAVVVVSFSVTLDGHPSGFKIVRSPGKQYADEAIRLLKEGPEWKPATENGVNIEDEVRVRIVFK
jgi:hypothetical protein